MPPRRCFSDTSDFHGIGQGDIIQVDGHRYIVTGEEKERRFGMEDPKFWVKRVVDETFGKRYIIKLSYFETFYTQLGGVRIRCFRSPEKEGRILDLVYSHPLFMTGWAKPDTGNNCVRILEIVRGTSFFMHVGTLRIHHRRYFETQLPAILQHLAKAFKAILFLHQNGFRHGDIRNDHIIIEKRTGNYVWIDFDYDFDAPENPFSLDIFGLGNILLYAVGKGFHNHYMINNDPFTYKNLKDRIEPDDFSILQAGRLVNLKKLYPYIPPMLNNILMHFSSGAHLYYESVTELLEDLNGYIRSV